MGENKMRVFYFDTSAINHFYDEYGSVFPSMMAERNVIVLPSFFNIVEVASTPDKQRRIELLKVMRAISDNYKPLASPGELLRRSVVAISTMAPEMEQSVKDDEEGISLALNEPEQIDDEIYQGFVRWKQDEEKWYKDMHRQGRPHIQEIIERDSATWIASRFSAFIKSYKEKICQEDGSVFCLVSKAASDVGVKVDKEFVTQVIGHSEHWRFFLSSMAYGIWGQSVRTIKSNKKKNPGSIDTQQAIYMAACDIFVTADVPQYKMLQLLISFGHKKRQVWKYTRFSNWINGQ